MPAKAPAVTGNIAAKTLDLGRKIRLRRKALGISATVTAEAAGMSRVTLYRIENGEPSVTIGAYFNVLAALGLDFDLKLPLSQEHHDADPCLINWIPVRINLADYPMLKQLAWQVHGTDELTPKEALSIYERNWRHLEPEAMTVQERQLVNALRKGLGDGSHGV